MKPFCFAWVSIALLLAISPATSAQQNSDSLMVRPFARGNSVQFFPGYYRTAFRFSAHSFEKTRYRLLGNTSAYAGFFLNYEWVSLLLSPGIPGTSIDPRDRNISSMQIQGYHFWHALGGEFQYTRLRGLLLKTGNRTKTLHRLPGINYSGLSANLYFFPNHAHYSYPSSMYASDLQVRSAGSPLVMLTPSWHRFRNQDPPSTALADSLSRYFINRQPEWSSLVTRVGYSYNFVFRSGKWSLNPLVLVGTGFSREKWNGKAPLFPIEGYQFRLNAAYNGARFFLILNSILDRTSSQIRRVFVQYHDMDMSLTAGIRFRDLPHKILGVL